MIQNIIDKFKKMDLNPDCSLLERKKDIEAIYSDMYHHFSYSFDLINSKPDTSQIETLKGNYFNFRDSCLVGFKTEILNSKFRNNYTSWCPELIGCFAEGKTKTECLEKLLFNIAEIFVLNYDLLNVNPFYESSFTPLALNNDLFLNHSNNNCVTTTLRLNHLGFNDIYMGFNNIFIKKDNESKVTFSIPYDDYDEFSKHILDHMLDYSMFYL